LQLSTRKHNDQLSRTIVYAIYHWLLEYQDDVSFMAPLCVILFLSLVAILGMVPVSTDVSSWFERSKKKPKYHHRTSHASAMGTNRQNVINGILFFEAQLCGINVFQYYIEHMICTSTVDFEDCIYGCGEMCGRCIWG
jgi:hypothetical protein